MATKVRHMESSSCLKSSGTGCLCATDGGPIGDSGREAAVGCGSLVPAIARKKVMAVTGTAMSFRSVVSNAGGSPAKGALAAGELSDYFVGGP